MDFEKLINDLIERNWTTVENFVDENSCKKLISEFEIVNLKKAKVGGGQTRTFRPEIRSDSIFWLDILNASDEQKKYLNSLEELKNAVNQELYIGLKELECHFALYTNGEFYTKHTDQFKNNNSRTLTVITYLNTPKDGGELVIYNKKNPEEIDKIIKPKAGLLVCFLSDQLYHEVYPAKDARYSITGWFKNQIS